MLRTISTALLCWLFLLAQSHGQDVFVPRQLKAIAVPQSEKEQQQPLQIRKALLTEEPVLARQTVTTQPTKTASAKKPPASPHAEKVQSAKAEPVKVPAVKELPAKLQPEKIQSVKTQPVQPASEPTVNVRLVNEPTKTASTRLADGFDFPVGKPEAEGYYKARGFRTNGHMGEDWDGIGGGDTALGAPIYSIGDGIVVFARDVHLGWGNVVIIRHAYREKGAVKYVDSLYGHLKTRLVGRGQRVARGQQIATMGTAHGQYDAHLHLEIRKNITIGMSRDAFAHDFSNYYDPSQFILSHRNLQTGARTYRVAMNTFTRDGAIRWDKARNYSRHRGGTGESAAALKKALASQH